ncbi:hypothetical protein GCE86_08770 [Micromonospora terminaliae]|uniref:NACHT domain-containing protein n=1 Tax=Micromonospora terminaliae TaxID=1914461 RepID=A0ABX6DZ89_9ACTN|nr:hypothetical protein [Micromonospora terminaliae]QGL47134.1 hypothetical protein GCE86_08770 [Micromonospora terminaliae]
MRIAFVVIGMTVGWLTLPAFFLINDRNEGSILVQTTITVVVGTVGMLSFLPSRPDKRTLDDAARELARAVHQRWTEAAMERQLRHPAPIPVRLLPSTVGVGPARAPMSLSSPAPRDTASLSALYDLPDCDRLVLLGGEGTGKSSAAMLLLLDVLNRSTSDGDRAKARVPVLFSLTGWDPDETDLEDWLVERMTVEYPFLKAPDYGPDVARRLLVEDRLVVLLDGLDQLPVGLRSSALQALNGQASFQLVLISRTDAMRDAAAGGWLVCAVAFELVPLSNHEAADYLGSCRPQEDAGPWCDLVEHVRNDSDSPISRALCTPLMLSLVRDNYAFAQDPRPLLDFINQHFTDSTEAEGYLLDRVITAAYTDRPRRPRRSRRPHYKMEEARRWLAYAAHEMQVRGTEDLAWWRIREWRPPTFRFQTTAVAATLGPGLVLGYGSGHSLVAAAVGGAAGGGCGVLVGILIARRIPMQDCRSPRQLGSIRWSRPALADPSRVGSVEGRVDGLVFGLLAGLVFGFALGFRVGRGVLAALVATLVGGLVGAGLGAAGGSYVKRKSRPEAESSARRRWRPVSRDSIGLGVVFVVLGGAAGWASALGVAWGTVFGVTVWLILRIIFRLAVGATMPSADANSPIDPLTCWRRDRLHGLVLGLIFGLVFGLVSGAVLVGRTGLRPWTGAGLMAWIGTWSVIGLLAGRVYSNTWSVSLTFLELHRRGLAPLRMLRFLEDAHQRGVLRTAGPVYQFRHSRLRDRLAAQCVEPQASPAEAPRWSVGTAPAWRSVDG